MGALGYLFFDIAVLWATFSAMGHPPPVAALILAYTIGYLASSLPIPGGIGVLDAGLTGALLLYGASPVHAAAAVLVYHAVAFWVPSVGGVIAYGRLGIRMSSSASRVGDRPCVGAGAVVASPPAACQPTHLQRAARPEPYPVSKLMNPTLRPPIAACAATRRRTANGSSTPPARPSPATGWTSAWSRSPGSPGSATPPSTATSPRRSLVEALFDDWFDRHRVAGERALEDPDAWHGLTVFLEQVLSDASRNRALLDMFMIRLHRGDVASAPISRLLRRAQESGDVRTDVSLEDMFLVFWGFGRTLSITGDAAPEQWRRQLALMLDGIRPRSGQAPLPGEAISHEKLDGLIGDWAQDAVGRCRGSGGC